MDIEIGVKTILISLENHNMDFFLFLIKTTYNKYNKGNMLVSAKLEENHNMSIEKRKF